MLRLTRLQWMNKSKTDFDAALLRAFASFERVYPQWADYLFDEHFLAGKAAGLLARYQKDGIAPEPNDLAVRWANQIYWTDQARKQKRISQAIPVAERFLCILAAELRVLTTVTKQAAPQVDDCGPASAWETATAGL